MQYRLTQVSVAGVLVATAIFIILPFALHAQEAAPADTSTSDTTVTTDTTVTAPTDTAVSTDTTTSTDSPPSTSSGQANSPQADTSSSASPDPSTSSTGSSASAPAETTTTTDTSSTPPIDASSNTLSGTTTITSSDASTPTDTTASPTDSTMVDPTPAPTSAPEITTDKADYHPGETVTIFGKFFASLQHILLAIVGQDNSGNTIVTDSWSVDADTDGGFTTQYTLPQTYVPLYLIAANSSTGELLAETTFTDAVNSGSGSMAVSTTSVPLSSVNSFTFTFSTDTGKDLTAACSQVTLTIPSGWTAPQSSVSGNPGYISVANISCTSASLSSVSSSVITVNINCAKGTKQFTITYGSATAPSTAGSSTFLS